MSCFPKLNDILWNERFPFYKAFDRSHYKFSVKSGHMNIIYRRLLMLDRLDIYQKNNCVWQGWICEIIFIIMCYRANILCTWQNPTEREIITPKFHLLHSRTWQKSPEPHFSTIVYFYAYNLHLVFNFSWFSRKPLHPKYFCILNSWGIAQQRRF